jgi:hypothetical protein
MCSSGGLVPHRLPHVESVRNHLGVGCRSAVVRSAASLTRVELVLP